MASFVDVIHRKREWRGYPGLWDPYRVIETCLSELNTEVYVNIKWNKIDRSRSDRAILKKLCPGVQRYLDPWPKPDQQLKEDVLEYISNPCSERLKNIVKRDKMTCIFFMLEYFTIRGAFIKLQVDENGMKRNLLSSTFLATLILGRLKNLPCLDFCAATALGRYLNYMVTISNFHKYFYFKEVISQLYGPIFLDLDVADDAKYVFKDKKTFTNFITRAFSNILEVIPWNQLDPLTDVPRCVFPTGERDLYRKDIIDTDHLTSLSKIPDDLRSVLESRSADLSEISVSLDPDRAAFETDKKFPPDKCCLPFQQTEPVSDI